MLASPSHVKQREQAPLEADARKVPQNSRQATALVSWPPHVSYSHATVLAVVGFPGSPV